MLQNYWKPSDDAYSFGNDLFSKTVFLYGSNQTIQISNLFRTAVLSYHGIAGLSRNKVVNYCASGRIYIMQLIFILLLVLELFFLPDVFICSVSAIHCRFLAYIYRRFVRRKYKAFF